MCNHREKIQEGFMSQTSSRADRGGNMDSRLMVQGGGEKMLRAALGCNMGIIHAVAI